MIQTELKKSDCREIVYSYGPDYNELSNDAEEAAYRWARNEWGMRIPYHIEFHISPGEVKGFFEIKKQSHFMAMIIIFYDEKQKLNYLLNKNLHL